MTTQFRSITPLDAASFAANVERITNHALIDEWLAIYHPDAVTEWIADGALERHEGIDEIRPAATALASMWRKHHLTVHKDVLCADDTTIALSWTGGFGDEQSQRGIEIWTFRDGLVIDHRMHAYLDVRPSTSPLAKLRVFAAAPRASISLLRASRQP